MLIDKSTFPFVAIDSMNDVHFEEVDLINEVGELISARASDKENEDQLSSKLDELLVHIQDHFAIEQKRMVAYGFPAYPVHKAEHDQVLQELTDLHGQWKETGDSKPVENYIQNVLPNWMVEHVSTLDTVTSQYIKSRMEDET